jgi:hypothetical protein
MGLSSVSDTTPDWRTLIPFHVREAISLKDAAAVAGKSQRTVRRWCSEHGIGRRIADGSWAVSRVALAMLLEDRTMSSALIATVSAAVTIQSQTAIAGSVWVICSSARNSRSENPPAFRPS